jgi:membrane-bound serine protease (ClpP class)
MSALEWAILLAVSSAALFVIELCVPAHGVGAVSGLLCALGAVVACCLIGPWVGAGAVVCALLLAPGLGWFLEKAWPRSPLGRQLVLQQPADAPRVVAAQVGEEGVAISELRPMGICELNGRRVAVQCAHGQLAAGSRVVVIAAEGNSVIVRPAGN